MPAGRPSWSIGGAAHHHSRELVGGGDSAAASRCFKCVTVALLHERCSGCRVGKPRVSPSSSTWPRSHRAFGGSGLPQRQQTTPPARSLRTQRARSLLVDRAVHVLAVAVVIGHRASPAGSFTRLCPDTWGAGVAASRAFGSPGGYSKGVRTSGCSRWRSGGLTSACRPPSDRGEKRSRARFSVAAPCIENGPRPPWSALR
jgi:hypothetical protein